MAQAKHKFQQRDALMYPELLSSKSHCTRCCRDQILQYCNLFSVELYAHSQHRRRQRHLAANDRTLLDPKCEGRTKFAPNHRWSERYSSGAGALQTKDAGKASRRTLRILEHNAIPSQIVICCHDVAVWASSLRLSGPRLHERNHGDTTVMSSF